MRASSEPFVESTRSEPAPVPTGVGRMALGVSGRRFDLPHIGLYGIEAGNGPLVVCLHGITANAYVWLPVMEHLARTFRVLAIDQRGHGRSDKPKGPLYAAADYARDAAALIQHVDAGRAILLGHSLGARNALALAASIPDWIAAVLAVDFTPFIEADAFNALEARVSGGDRDFATTEAVEEYLSDRYRRLPADAIRRRALYGFGRGATGRLAPLADAQAMAETCGGLRADLSVTLGALRVPTLLVRGEDSTFVSRAAFARTRRLRPDLAAVEIAGADHYVPEEQPLAVAQALIDFVRTSALSET